MVMIKKSIEKELNRLGYNLIESNKKLGNELFNIYTNGILVLKVGVESITKAKTHYDNMIYIYELNSNGVDHKAFLGASLGVRKQVEKIRQYTVNEIQKEIGVVNFLMINECRDEETENKYRDRLIYLYDMLEVADI